MKRAQVVVDVPGTVGDQTFTYLVPPQWEEEICIGARVVVPFGPRRVDGIVVELHDAGEHEKNESTLQNSTTSDYTLREIEEVVPPPLNEELVNLGYWLSRKTLCPLMAALKAMVPAGLRGKYTSKVSLAAGVIPQTTAEQEIVAFLQQRSAVEWKKLLRAFPQHERLLMRWRREGKLSLQSSVQRPVRVKKVAYLRPLVEADQWNELLASSPSRAVKQRKVLEYLRDHPQREWPQSDLLKRLGVSTATINALIQKGILERYEKEVLREPAHDPVDMEAPPVLTAEQQTALASIVDALSRQTYHAFLLHGVTGSGKTEVYLQAIAHCLRQGRAAIVLVPEISLTPQMVERFRRRYGPQVAVFHSGLAQGERFDEWRRIQEGRAQVVIGARSAVFAPFVDIGLIIVDEEHESTYKQEETPRYHARDVALRRARYHQAVVVLGSATPSLEAYATALKGGFTLLQMTRRVHGRPLPQVHLVDLRQELQTGNRSLFSRLLAEKMAERFARQEQVILFQHRRGFAHFVMCRSCGMVMKCPSCDISLTYHRVGQHLRCHYCGYTVLEPAVCPECGSGQMRHLGVGTQRVEEELNRLFPGVRILRMDADTTTQKGAHQQLLNRFFRQEADVLLGTQMIAKGLDFPKVTLVGVVLADTLLYLPDFRASERTFQLLTQVSGRAGRHERPGEVVIQSFNPEHEIVQAAASQDYARFFAREMIHRRRGGYPPYCRLAQLLFAHPEAAVALSSAVQVTRRLQERLKGAAQVIGPVAAPIARMKNRYRFQSMIKYNNEPMVRTVLQETLAEWEPLLKKQDVQLIIDIDPRVLL